MGRGLECVFVHFVNRETLISRFSRVQTFLRSKRIKDLNNLINKMFIFFFISSFKKLKCQTTWLFGSVSERVVLKTPRLWLQTPPPRAKFFFSTFLHFITFVSNFTMCKNKSLTGTPVYIKDTLNEFLCQDKQKYFVREVDIVIK